ncbi:MAG: VOC family protein [Pseudomonadota bacterium]
MIDGAAIYAIDLEKMKRCYLALGYQLLEEAENDYATLGSQDSELSLVQIPPAYAAGINISSPPAARDETPIKLIFRVADLDAALATLQDHGGRPAEGSARWTFRGFDLQDAIDPEGNVIQLKAMAKAGQ